MSEYLSAPVQGQKNGKLVAWGEVRREENGSTTSGMCQKVWGDGTSIHSPMATVLNGTQQMIGGEGTRNWKSAAA